LTVTRSSLVVRPLTPTIGAEVVGVDLATAPASTETMKELEQALLQHLVLFFRDQDITPEQQARFAGWFGPYEQHPFAKADPNHPNVVVLDQTTPKTDGANTWHTDSSFMETPALASVLRAVQLPANGGDTCWASMYAAWDGLSPRMQQYLDGLSALHDITMPLEKAIAGGHSSTMDMEAVRRDWPPFAQPVARVHPLTGRKLLYVNENFTTRIMGIPKAESDLLLEFLFHHIPRPDFQVRFHWEEGSMAFWDNRCTQHYAVPDYTGERRVMHRVTLTGDRPV
jgi:taurine dioxygenase